MTPIFDEILRLFETRGASAYLGEDVSQSEHALQAAHLARLDGADAPLVVAALLHDVGHLLGDEDGDDAAEHGVDARHEDAGARWLAGRFGPDVAGPAWLHVAAKRYLCTVDPAYRAGLSSASVLSLRLQGGPLDAAGRAVFEADPHHREALRLRRWDDLAKEPGLDVPSLIDYREAIESVALAREAAGR